ncbi:5-methyltetrahydropteroyltriglutamate-homocysteine methyltransferase [Aspergillus terreus]|uniref:5-methyltetrahydropteroyltriglutamate-homocysteine methyltransferase n=1 Tax=Aspergillus terreus TaxID=33178 RepID=A0A5M3Z947_ASPTE|nr:hypothetical protein ATETN484_0011054500 [Aspergillus terreus]GFF19187.1 5-methyltetrahydropteroyltriglutamate-homocysteine methyltransferase [Aspergillus terreus]
MAPPFRTEQVGSLLRPAPLVAARTAANPGSRYLEDSLPEEVQRLTEQAVAEVVQQQLAQSIRPITSGEYSRSIFYAGFFEKLHGFAVTDVPVPQGFRSNHPTIRLMEKLRVPSRPAAVAVGRIEHRESPYLGEWLQLRQFVPEGLWKECKFTMPPVTWDHMHLAVGAAYTPSSGYATDREYFQDLAAAYVKEFRVLYDAGVRSIQIDDPCLTFFVTDQFRAGCIADGEDPDALLDLYIWAHNQCLAGRPSDLHVGIHLCRGNMPQGRFVSTGSYERIAERLFQKLDYDTFYLEYDTERAGDFQPLRHLPVGKNVVLGLVSTKEAELERLEDLEARVYEAAEVIARAQGRSRAEVLATSLAVSPQCGFASMSSGHGVGMTMERMWEKLQLVQALAGRIWPV